MLRSSHYTSSIVLDIDKACIRRDDRRQHWHETYVVHYDAVLAFFVFFGDPASPLRFFLVLSAAASVLLGFDGLLAGCATGAASTSISPESSIGARDPSGAKRCLSSSGGCLGRGGFWCTTGEDSGDDAGGVGREGRAEITRRREMACGAALLHSIMGDVKRRKTTREEGRGDAPWYSFPFFLRRGRRHETARSSSPPTASASSSPSDHTSYAVLFLSTLPIRAVLEDEGSSILTFSRCLGLSFVKNGACSAGREGRSEGQDVLHQVPALPRARGYHRC